MDPERIAPPIFRPEHSAKRMALTPEAEEFSFIENLPRFYGTSQEMDRAIELIADLRTENATLAAQAERLRAALGGMRCGWHRWGRENPTRHSDHEPGWLCELAQATIEGTSTLCKRCGKLTVEGEFCHKGCADAFAKYGPMEIRPLPAAALETGAQG